MKLSIITINYNNKDGLQKTIESVICQSVQNFEYVVIDGGSTDGSTDIIEQYNKRIDFWISESDKGIYNAMNKGVYAAHGEYLLFLNSGDYLCDKNVVQNLYTYKLDTDFICGNIIFGNGGVMKSPDTITMNYFIEGSLPHPSSFIKRKLFDSHPYDERFKISGDWEFFLYHLIVQNASYKTINLNVSVFDTTGISSKTKKEQCDPELVQETIKKLLFPRIQEDYKHFRGEDDTYFKLFYTISHSRYKRLIYKLVVCLLKAFMLNRGWIRSFHLNCC